MDYLLDFQFVTFVIVLLSFNIAFFERDQESIGSELDAGNTVSMGDDQENEQASTPTDAQVYEYFWLSTLVNRTEKTEGCVRAGRAPDDQDSACNKGSSQAETKDPEGKTATDIEGGNLTIEKQQTNPLEPISNLTEVEQRTPRSARRKSESQSQQTVPLHNSADESKRSRSCDSRPQPSSNPVPVVSLSKTSSEAKGTSSPSSVPIPQATSGTLRKDTPDDKPVLQKASVRSHIPENAADGPLYENKESVSLKLPGAANTTTPSDPSTSSGASYITRPSSPCFAPPSTPCITPPRDTIMTPPTAPSLHSTLHESRNSFEPSPLQGKAARRKALTLDIISVSKTSSPSRGAQHENRSRKDLVKDVQTGSEEESRVLFETEGYREPQDCFEDSPQELPRNMWIPPEERLVAQLEQLSLEGQVADR